jgi:oligopeptide/dipeptide ABC transporter ATP-binding protein
MQLMSKEKLLTVHNLRIIFPTKAGELVAVDGIDFNIKRGEVLGLVGESGSGKTMTGRAILGLIPRPGRITHGQILFGEKGDLLKLNEEEMRQIRGKEIAAIQQDPLSSLNPAFTIQEQMIDIIKLHKKLGKEQATKEAINLLSQLGIPKPEAVLRKYPHQLSGGMAQRIMIGIAFSCNPSLIIADEPTTALDVITQATVINLMKKMQEKFRSSILFITHNLGLASKICDRIAVMYAGKIVEFSSVSGLFSHPSHPYTKGLLSAVPKLSDTTKQMSAIAGGMPDLVNAPKGCRFYSRCPIAVEKCGNSEISFTELPESTSEHRSLCIRAQEVFEKKI